MKDTPVDKKCPKCGTWMKQTSGYLKEGVSHGTSWECPSCGHDEEEQ
jgi:predicted RNA-binding Zn-ribbon protein involved in translation (DUF1610 family)